jgi:hypothetical protein
MPRSQPRLPSIGSPDDLFAFLRDDLNWPLPEDALADEVTFDWSGDDLRLQDGATQKLKGGTIRQLRPLVPGQPWGVFLVEFADTQVYRTALRQVLRGLVPNRRRNASLQAWQHENLLFICATADYERLTFAHFRGDKAGTAKLATFGWRRGTAYLRTLLEHNIPRLQWPDDDGADRDNWLAAWAAAFDKEAVTRKFFADFSSVFESLSIELQTRHAKWSKDIIEREAQTLLNRLLFLYFIQRKGWLNRQRDYLARHLLSHVADEPNGFSFYQKFLLPLFRMLSTEWKRRDAAIAGAAPEDPRSHDLPFLNGGLFSDEFGAEQLDPSVRRHHELRVSNATLARVFDELLEAYNFTVREDTPLDVDVAIDPEMLGKIFESLVLQLEVSGSGGKSSRHNTGSYYTPRPVVHYLCRDALGAWLAGQPVFADISDRQAKIQTLLSLDASAGAGDEVRRQLDALLTPDQARAVADTLDQLRACDPAVGSGAFPVVLLHELLNLARLCETRARGKDPVATDADWLFLTKTRLIERVLYGVDLQPRAIEICKLRLWLSLVVDYPLDVDVDSCERRSFQSALRKLPALPNLDFKIRAANALADHIHGQRFLLRNLAAEDRARLPLSKLVAAKRDFFKADSVTGKRRLRFAIYESLTDLGELELTRARNEYGLMPSDADGERAAELEQARKELASVRVRIQAARRLSAVQQEEALEDIRAFFDDEQKPTFVWQLDFAEVFHREHHPRFDLLIGNPPYVRIQVLNQDNPDFAAWLKENYRAAGKGNYDLYVVFVERSLQLLQDHGQLAFILPHKFFNAQYGQPLRELLGREAEDKKAAAKVRRSHLRHVVHFGDQQIFPGATNYVCLLFLAAAGAEECRWVRADNLPDWLATLRAPETALPAARLTAAEWNFAVGQAGGLFDKLQRMPVKLGDVCSRMFQGPITSADTVFLFKDFKPAKKGIVEVFSKELDEPFELEAGILKRVIRSGSIGRYHAQTTAMVLFPYAVQNNEATLLSPTEMQTQFPSAWAYLKRNKRLLEGREGGAFKDNEWYRFGRAQNLGLWEQPKLMVPYMITELGAYLDQADHFYFINVTTGGYGITSTDQRVSLPYLCALLNSRLLDFYFKRVSTNFHGGYFAANKQFIEQLPIRPIDFASASERAEHDALAGLVERILSAKRANPLADTSVLEREIDQRVYRLYALTSEEIQLVEEGAK